MRARGVGGARHNKGGAGRVKRACTLPEIITPSQPQLRFCRAIAGLLQDNAGRFQRTRELPLQHCDILIIGGGMAGLSQALSLSGLGLRVVLVDNQSAPPAVASLQSAMQQPQFSDRVSALTPATRQFFETLGVWDSLAALRLCPYRHMQVWDADGSGQIHFAADDLHLDCLGYLVENPLVNAVLAEAAAATADLELVYQSQASRVERQDKGWQLWLDNGQILTCSLLIGADGGSSRIRELAGFRTREWSYGQRALVCTVRTEQPHGFTAWQRFLGTGPVAYLPLYLPGAPAQHYCSIVWSCDEPLAEELLGLSSETFALRLGAALEQRLGAVQVLSAPVAFPLQQRHATDYVQDAVALVGDAAHTIHPLAGQGINLGFADVQSLGGVIQRAVTRGEDFTSLQVLSRYQRARKPANLGMMLGMEGFKRAFGSDALLVRYLRNQGLNLADRLGPLKQGLMQQAMGLTARPQK
jgi:2-octaprenylphenol hydroxylase